MPDPPATLRFTNRSIAVAVVLTGATLLVLRVLGSSTRVLGWLAVAVVMAGLLHPLAQRLARYLPRRAAVPMVMLGTVAAFAGVAYLGVDAVVDQANRLEEAAPRAAAEIEQDDRFGEAAREFELQEKVQDFVDELPERLRGGTAAEAIRANTTRGVAYLATFVLTLFMVIHGPRLIRAGIDQMGDDRRARRLDRLVTNAHRRWSRYLALVTARAAAAGLFGWAVARFAEAPAAVLMGMIVAFGSFLPSIGLLLGSVPLLLLTVADDFDRAVLVLVVVLLAQVADAAFVQREIERRSLHVGPFITFLGAMVGFELYGFGGLVVGFTIVVFAAAVAKELAPTDDSDMLEAADAILPGDDESDPDHQLADADRVEAGDRVERRERPLRASRRAR